MTGDLYTRAIAAYFRAGEREQPSESLSGCEELEGKQYVVLRSTAGTLAVYRVRNDGILKRLKRWSRELDRT